MIIMVQHGVKEHSYNIARHGQHRNLTNVNEKREKTMLVTKNNTETQ